MAKAKTAAIPPRAMPSGGGSWIRDTATGALRPNSPPPQEPAAEPAQEDN